MPFVFIINTGEVALKKADLTSQVDGNTTVFNVPVAYEAGTLRVYYNGVRQESGNGFSETTTTTFTTVFTPQNGETIAVDYKEA